ncbi:MFS transporter [Geodermatophilus sabuli]|uniref:MFS transporter n=1 Tax=Geodermatophilus sabuli TaxID=1564158 RepID=A0A7K3W2K8_9ACTN|nr:MFS transporter [Geodermatophilus sabuli]NEK58424.1 MFS transporter [Geodermatophilus sabuli]
MADPSSVVGRRAAVVAVCTAAMGAGTAPAFLYGYLGPEIRADLDLSRGGLGLLIGLFYGLTGLGSLVAARVAQPWGARRCIVVDQVVVAGCLLASVAFPSALVLGLAAGVAGVGYALGNAGTSMAVAATAPAGRAGRDLTVKTAGVPLMATVLALAGPAVARSVGWEGVALALAVVAAATAVAGGLLLPARPAARGRGVAATAEPDRPLPPGFALLPLAAFLFIAGSQPLLSWLVLSLTDAGVGTATAGAVSAAGTGAGVVAMVLVARLSDRVGPPRRALVAAGLAGLALLGVLLLWSTAGSPLVLVVVGAVVGLFGNLAGASTIHAVVVDRAPWAVGRAIALMSTGYFLGALVAPWAFGLAADLTGGYALSWGGCAVALAGSAVCFVLVHRRVAVPGLRVPG